MSSHPDKDLLTVMEGHKERAVAALLEIATTCEKAAAYVKNRRDREMLLLRAENIRLRYAPETCGP